MMPDPPRLLDDAQLPIDVQEALRGAEPTTAMPERLLARSGRRIAMMAAFPAFMAGLFKAKVAIAAVIMLSVSAVAVTSAVVVHEHGSEIDRRPVLVAGQPSSLPSPLWFPPQVTPEATFTAGVPSLPTSEPHVKQASPQARATIDLPSDRTSPSDLLAEEVRLLQEAKALAKVNPTGALAKTQEHATRFPKGTLSLEREMVAIEALVSAGRMQDARARAHALRTVVKGTIYASRLESLVGPDVP